jgi:lipoate-protein ligase A
MNTVHLLDLENHFILSQLQLEEALLRADNRNWCIINHGSPQAIVMGISAKPHLLLHCEQVMINQVPVIRRFSGGGTVIVDQNTLFASFIFNHNLLSIPAQPETIMKWSESFYSDVFQLPGFKLRENDFVMGERKFGGNAQYLRKDRWLHHTSFLWDFNQENMNYLKFPAKTPLYRQERSHEDFLCSLRPHHPSKSEVLDRIRCTLQKHFEVVQVPLSEAEEVLQRSYRKTTHLLSQLDL